MTTRSPILTPSPRGSPVGRGSDDKALPSLRFSLPTRRTDTERRIPRRARSGRELHLPAAHPPGRLSAYHAQCHHRLCPARCFSCWHITREKLQRDEAAPRFTHNPKSCLDVAPPRITLGPHLAGIHERHHTERWWIPPLMPRCGDGLSNQLARYWPRLTSEQRINPRPWPCVLDVLSIWP